MDGLAPAGTAEVTQRTRLARVPPMKRLVNTSSSSTLQLWLSGRPFDKCADRRELERGQDPELDAEVVLVIRRIESPMNRDRDECRGGAPQQWPSQAFCAVEGAPAAPQQHRQKRDECRQAEEAELGPHREVHVVRVQLWDPVPGDVRAHDLRVRAQTGAHDRVVAEHVERVAPDLDPALEGVEVVVRVQLPREALVNDGDLRDGEATDHGSTEEDRLHCPVGHREHGHQRQHRQREPAGARQRGEQRDEEYDEARGCDPAVALLVRIKREPGGDGERWLEEHRYRVGARVKRFGRVPAVDRRVGCEGGDPSAQVHEGEDRGPNGEAEEHDAEVRRCFQKVDRDVEERDRFDEIGAVDADRTDVVGRDRDTHEARDEQQDDGDLEGGARRPPVTTLEATGDVEADGDEDEVLEQRGGDGTDAVAHHIERHARHGHGQRPAAVANQWRFGNACSDHLPTLWGGRLARAASRPGGGNRFFTIRWLTGWIVSPVGESDPLMRAVTNYRSSQTSPKQYDQGRMARMVAPSWSEGRGLQVPASGPNRPLLRGLSVYLRSTRHRGRRYGARCGAGRPKGFVHESSWLPSRTHSS